MLAKDKVEEADDRRVAAMIASDVDQLNSLFSDALLWVHASGKVDTKTTMLEQVASGSMRCFSIERSGVVIRLFGNVAVSTGVIDMDAQVGSLRKKGRSCVTGVWLEDGDTIRLISWQSARLQ